MKQEKFIPDQHQKTRSFFRMLGPACLIIGVVCMVVAAIDFFTLQGFEEPKYFWLFFVALPMLFIGFVLSGLGFGGVMAKYQSREYAPVAKDTFNYLAKETTSGVREISNAIQQGSALNRSITCPNCQHDNPNSSNFCKACGGKLVLICMRCEQVNTSDAQFCNNCGRSLKSSSSCT